MERRVRRSGAHWYNRSDPAALYIRFRAPSHDATATRPYRAISCSVVCHPVSRPRGRRRFLAVSARRTRPTGAPQRNTCPRDPVESVNEIQFLFVPPSPPTKRDCYTTTRRPKYEISGGQPVVFGIRAFPSTAFVDVIPCAYRSPRAFDMNTRTRRNE